jgi:hypothetical protein
MIIRILSNGKSFKGAAAYLTHDPDADTSKRVEWTHTLNLANEDVPSAVNEMVWTARDAELLKQEAGVRAGGRATETPVKHFSLNWAPEDKPTPKHMIETTQEFLRHMGWHEHQAIIVAHNDKSYAHAHVLLNCVHPETGLKLDDGFEQRRPKHGRSDMSASKDASIANSVSWTLNSAKKQHRGISGRHFRKMKKNSRGLKILYRKMAKNPATLRKIAKMPSGTF